MEKVIKFNKIDYRQQANTYRNSIPPAKLLIEKYNALPLKDITDSNFEAFIADPTAYFESQVLALKEKRFGSDPIDINEFKKLYKLDFTGGITNSYWSVLEMKKGIIQVKPSNLEALQASCTTTTTNPQLIRQLEAVSALVKQYDEVYKLCFGSGYSHLKNDFSELMYNRFEKGFNDGVLKKFLKLN